MKRPLALLFGPATSIVLAARAAAPQAAAVVGPRPSAPCDVEYVLSAELRITETPLGAGDGTHVIGPGKVLLHFGEVDGAGMRVQLQALEIREQFNVVAGALFLKAAVTTDGIARAASDAGGPIAEGTLLGRTLRWSTPVRGFRQDGTVTCEGSLCGKFGGPPQGRSGMHSGPDAVSFQPFEFAGDLKTFTMRFSVISSSDSPKHRSFLAIAGREVRRACASTDDPR